MRIRWTTPAARDLTRICDYIEKEADSETARRIALPPYEGVDSLKQFPPRYRPGSCRIVRACLGKTLKKLGWREIARPIKHEEPVTLIMRIRWTTPAARDLTRICDLLCA